MSALGISNIIALLSGVALFLFGMSVMGDSLKRVAGNKLEVVLYRLSGTTLKGVLLGAGVTAVIQSSSATSVMVVGFVNSGMMKVRQAIGIVLGAILGTSITGWIISLSYINGGSGFASLLSTATLTGVIAVIGILLRMVCKDMTKRHVGDILMGFAVLMFGMSAMSDAVAPLKEAKWFTDVLVTFSNPLLGILAGLLFTSVLQSASAAVGIIQALSVTGAMEFNVAFPIILGIALGAAVPVLLSALGANTDGKRTAFVYLVVELLGVAVCAVLFYVANAIFHFSFMNMTMTPVSIALVNTLFRMVMVLLLLPFVSTIETLVNLLIRDKPKEKKENAPLQLEERFIIHPSLAIEQSRISINKMAKLARKALVRAMALLDSYSEEGYKEVAALEEKVDKYEDGLGTYLMKCTTQEMNEEQSESVSKFLHTLSDFERISDHALNIAQVAQEIHEKKLKFSDQAAHELQVISSAVNEVVDIAIRSFTENNLQSAVRVEPLEELINRLCDEMKLHHVNRLQQGVCTLSQGFVFNDLLTNFERISDHCSNIAVAMIELESDTFDTHQYLNSLREVRTASFAAYYDEYQKRYSLE